jgi:SWI/SNF-related matrix-associated actin-dependent regulator of chromatin subfamily A3
MGSLSLRRTKEMQNKNGQPLVPLPPVTVITVKVPLDVVTREFYDAVERESAARVNEFFLRGADPYNVSRIEGAAKNS